MEVVIGVAVLIIGALLFFKWLEYDSRYVVNRHLAPDFWDWLFEGEDAPSRDD